MSIPEEMVRELQIWHRSKEAASRYNRNLLQYATAMAALLGIEAGSGGVFIVGNALARGRGADLQLEWWALATLWSVVTMAAIIYLSLSLLLIRVYRRRREEESRAEVALESLIMRDPERFLPDKEDVMSKLTA